jgi:hypothetical protein
MAYPALRPTLAAVPPLALLLLSLAAPARAELGGPLASVEADRGRLGARMTSHALGGYRRHDLTRANGGGVHELTNANGRVFAVTWNGPGKPDLRALLGPYFATFQAGSTGYGRAMHALRRPPQVSRPDLRIQTAGHMGWFRGVALIPSLAPAGFDAAALGVQP